MSQVRPKHRAVRIMQYHGTENKDRYCQFY